MQILIINGKGGSGKSTLALALADVLQDAKLVDLDAQKTLTTSAKLTGRHTPVPLSQSTSRYTVIDTPGYSSSEALAQLKVSEVILVPAKLGYADLLATKATLDALKKKGALEKVCIVFNEVRRPANKTQGELEELFRSNFSHVRIAKSQLSNLLGFRRLLAEPLKGRALKEMQGLKRELAL